MTYEPYRYYDELGKGVSVASMLVDLESAPDESIVLL
jgi:aspartate/tyrosine/aromatic aminotransferase